MLVTKSMYTDHFFQNASPPADDFFGGDAVALLPPLMMTTPQVAVAGALEPAYDVAGDSFDYALNGDVLHLCMIDAMGHGLDAAVMATLAIGAYRHARRIDVEPGRSLRCHGLRQVADQFGPDRFATAQMARLDVGSGRLQWVNTGHPPPLLIRDGRIVGQLDTDDVPVGFGGATPS